MPTLSYGQRRFPRQRTLSVGSGPNKVVDVSPMAEIRPHRLQLPQQLTHDAHFSPLFSQAIDVWSGGCPMISGRSSISLFHIRSSNCVSRSRAADIRETSLYLKTDSACTLPLLFSQDFSSFSSDICHRGIYTHIFI